MNNEYPIYRKVPPFCYYPQRDGWLFSMCIINEYEHPHKYNDMHTLFKCPSLSLSCISLSSRKLMCIFLWLFFFPSLQPHHCHFEMCPPCAQVCGLPLAGCSHTCINTCHAPPLQLTLPRDMCTYFFSILVFVVVLLFLLLSLAGCVVSLVSFLLAHAL